MRSIIGFYAMALTAAGLLFMPMANAQDKSPAAPAPAAPGAKTAPMNIPDKKLDAAAAAIKDVSSIKATYDKKLAQAPDADKQRLTGEAEKAMIKAVTDQGLSVEEYSDIITVAQNDPVMRGKLLQRLK
jgi:hypothetical protein